MKSATTKIGLGTVQFGFSYGFTREKTQAEVDRILDACVENGVAYLDTAYDYGSSEEKIGSYLKRHPKNRGYFCIATKIGAISPAEAKSAASLEKRLRECLEKSLKALNVPKVGVWQLHRCDDYVTENPKFWKTVARMAKEKLFGDFGVSVYEVEEAEKILKRQPELVRSVQAPYNVFNHRFSALFSRARKQGAHFVASSVFLKGAVTCDESDLPPELQGLRPFKKKLNALSAEAGLVPAELALLDVLSRPEVAFALVGVDSAEELEWNVRAAGKMDRYREVGSRLGGLEVEDAALVDPRNWKSI